MSVLMQSLWDTGVISVLLPVALRAILYRQGSCDGQVAVV